ncbi:helix-turn-helix domain-containing protein [Pseudonocardia broussonetiae]|uniref:Helix-turn-helix transcriptional regulator n=1 Tax=Pseudonocardia broussonetiae TaxID=2736640 RepID=A0A6M6JJH4_9PSEU|nr:helix-turn-helix transcriptional regulator [Pseudonocardia broussonetiae]QJY47293.1 helix-turn-helix transcriptional regulator [Pseudonocardia broussonetiae]
MTSALDVHEDTDELDMWVCRFGRDEPGGWGLHHHREHQIIWVGDGRTTAVAGDRTYVLPPTRALFVPGGVPHDTRNRPPSALHCVYVRPEACPLDWTEPTVLDMTPLLRELTLALAGAGVHAEVEEQARSLFFALVRQVPDPGVAVPMPDDPRARVVAVHLVAAPADPRTLEDWAAQLSTSVSTLRRAFVAGTGMTFTDWRTQVRLRAALPMLADGLPVASAGRRAGFSSRAGFVDAFRRHFGRSPGAYARGGR